VKILRGLIDEIRPSPRDGELDIHHVGNLAQILGLCAKKHPGDEDTGGQIPLVPGARPDPWSIPAAPVPIRSRSGPRDPPARADKPTPCLNVRFRGQGGRARPR